MNASIRRYAAPVALAAAFTAGLALAAPPATSAAFDLQRFAAEFDLVLEESSAAFDREYADHPIMLAHAGGMAKDGCHKHKAAGERHWHEEGTAERGGECVKSGGRTVKVETAAAANPAELENLRLLVEAQKGQLASAIGDKAVLEAANSNLRIELEAEKDKARRWWQRASRAEENIELARLERDRAAAAARGANADAAAALAQTELVREIAEDAELRARGVGPRVDRRCRAAVEEIVHGDTGWLSDDVEVDGEAREALAVACLTP